MKKPKQAKQFDFSRYTTRFIALKFAYLGQHYNGFEHHANNRTPLPTIEEVLWKALTKTKLIASTGQGEVNWEGCDYSKCGRTDKGVSAFGQVISLRVRSNRPKPRTPAEPTDTDTSTRADNVTTVAVGGTAEPAPFDPIQDEILYIRTLNRVLPPSIRILAWCPSPPPTFSSRFSCRERRYRYFFTQPAYTPRPGALGLRQDYSHVGKPRKAGWLDLPAMREAANYLVGLHDFRNLCKLDAARQITNFERRITYASIDPASSTAGVVSHVTRPGYANLVPEAGKVYTFTVHGSAFLYHQVRCMVAILFLVGQGYEKPSVVKDLLDVQTNPTKPMYEMADDAPLVLWDCVFPDLEYDEHSDPTEEKKDDMEWVYTDNWTADGSTVKGAVDSTGRFGPGGVQDVAWSNWRKAKIDEVLAGSLLDLVAGQTGDGAGQAGQAGDDAEQTTTNAVSTLSIDDNAYNETPPRKTTKIFDGGNNYRIKGEYIPIMQRERLEPVEVMNARYAERKRVAREAASSPAAYSAEDES